MPYTVSSFDNFHLEDEDGTDHVGSFDSADEAIRAAEDVIDRFLTHDAALARSAADLVNRYSAFGQVPLIRGEPTVAFDADAYVARRAAEILEASESSRRSDSRS